MSTPTEEPTTGGCACGAVRYAFTGEPEFAFHCHCRKCQRATGGGHASAFAVAADDVKITGELKQYGAPADTGAQTFSCFCPACGSPVLSKTERFPERLYFHAATLDDPSTFAPGFTVFGEAAQPWDPPDERLAKSG